MRSPKLLEKMVDGLKNMSVDLLALDAEEEAWFKARLKGRHGMSGVGIHRGKPGDELPMMGVVPAWTDPKPARVPGQLTEDGY